jgi:hypothetical protein
VALTSATKGWWLIKIYGVSRLAQLEVAALEDVYWLEDSRARPALGKDFLSWTTARQALPTSKEQLDRLKDELWTEVVKTDGHASWSWGQLHIYLSKIKSTVFH